LLKILARITKPTAGYAEIRGRVGSLLEVGTGFHPELTGRENIYLNGAILGMKKAEIDKKFDEIVAFAEIEPFLDTPVKHYSTGMYMRLAFAVAAHLEPEILLVDEVLAVGDTEFQKKCIGKMEEVAGEGKTVVVVSHSMSTVKALCASAILLDCGMVEAIGPVDGVVNRYLGASRVDAADKIVRDEDHLTGVNKIRVKRIRLLNGVNNSFSVHWRQPISVSVEIEVFEQVDEVSFGAGLKTVDGTWVLCTHHDDYGAQPRWMLEPGKYIIKFTILNDLKPGIYKLAVGAHHHHYAKNLFHTEAINLEVLDHTEDGLTPLVYNPGLVNGRSAWEVPERVV
jgi:lipopolysaccharide transport system ATP-binding protein